MVKHATVVLFTFLFFVSLLRVTVVAETVNTGVVGEPVAAESFDNGIIAFSTDEFSVGFDLNGDSDTSDNVIRYYNVSSGVVANTTAVGENPAIGGSIIAFTTYEGYAGEDLNNDTDIDDYILRYYDIALGVTVNTGKFGLEPVVDDGIIVFFVAEDWLDKDLNGDGNKVDRFIWYYNVSSGTTFNATSISGTYPSKCGEIIAFVTWESWDAVDLNSDGDIIDSIVRYYNMSAGTITNTEAVGNEPSIDGNIIAFSTDEFDVGDLNGDGDASDHIIRYYDISAGAVINTAVYGDFPCVEGNLIAFETWEPNFGEDVNGDGDTNDMVIRYYDVMLGEVASTGEVGFYASVDGRRIAFGTYESYLDEDVNGDGDKDDTIIRYYTIPLVRQGDLVLDDNDVYVIEGRFDINGSIVVKENATLILRDAVVNFTQTSDWQYDMKLFSPLNGNPRLLAVNTTVTSTRKYSVNLGSDTYANVTDSTFTASPPNYCWLWASGEAYFTNLTIHGLSVSSDSNVIIFNSAIATLNVYTGMVIASHTNIGGANTYSTGTTLFFVCTIQNVYADNNSSQFILDSAVTRVTSWNNSSAWLVNSTYTELTAYNQSMILVGWYLDVHVLDEWSQQVPSANITVTNPNGFTYSGFTDASGWKKFVLAERIINITGSFQLENYTVTATYDVYTGQQSVNMSENQEITITLPFILPEFPVFLLLPAFITSTLAAVLIFKKKRVRV
ncbi:MAG: hypothetical protein QXJ02_03230 [Candidatus Bathyarchaeia archaeon]